MGRSPSTTRAAQTLCRTTSPPSARGSSSATRAPLPRVRAARLTCRPRRRRRSRRSRARRTSPCSWASTCRSLPAAAPVRGRGRASAVVGGCSVRPARRAAASRSRSTSRPRGRGLPDGVHWYDPIGHALVQVGPPARGRAPLVVTGVPWRTGWRYAERGLRHVYWDAGTMLAQTLALAGSAGRPRAVDALLRCRGHAPGRRRRHPRVPAGAGRPWPRRAAIRPSGKAAAGAVDAAPTEFPLVTRTQHAGDGARLGEPWDSLAARSRRRHSDPPRMIRRDPAPRFDAQDGSGRLDASRSLSLAPALCGQSRPSFRRSPRRRGGRARPLSLARSSARAAAWIAARRGLPGLLRAGALPRRLLRRDGRHRPRGLDDCGYREAQINAGIVEGRLHLAAFALGIGASGMTILDRGLEDLLGEPMAGLLFTCVGVPEYHAEGGRLTRCAERDPDGHPPDELRSGSTPSG